MAADKNLKLVLCWHMHQPEYRDLKTGRFMLPWTYLHVIKDYVDMAAHLEAVPAARAVVNFAPILLEQIEDYTRQTQAYLQNQTPLPDPLLAALVDPGIPHDPGERMRLVKECLRANRDRQINRYPPFVRLATMADWLDQNFDAVTYIDAQYIHDIVVWYHLAWMGETVKLGDARIRQLIEKGQHFTLHDRMELLKVISGLHANLISRYKALAINGQVELSVTPYAHPIMPLLLDINSALEAMPDAAMPNIKQYPGGEARTRWHLEKGLAVFKRFFGFTPVGCWPSEGSVSAATLGLLSDFGFKWAASGGSVLNNSLKLPENQATHDLHHPFRLKNTETVCFFRDDGLSDLIGFEYSKWHADDAVNDPVAHLETIAAQAPPGSVVSIIMDGENAWEYFPENGYPFLSTLYARLSSHPAIELTTFAECLAHKVPVMPLEKLVAGSWVYGTFSTWLGEPDKNRAWDMLAEAKSAFDRTLAANTLSHEQIQAAELQLAVCEGSDWFWWFGDYNPGEAVSNFEKQFRMNLANLYQLLSTEAPAYLSLSFTQGHGDPALGGAMRQGIKTD